MKTCHTCHSEKSRTEFYKRSGAPDGLRTECKQCYEERRSILLSDPVKKQRAYEKHKVASRKYATKFRLLNRGLKEYKENKKAHDAKYYLKHKAKNKARNSLYYQNNKQAISETNKKWRCNNKEKVKQYIDKRFHHYELTKEQWITLCTLYNNMCLCCGTSAKMTIDHVIPLSKGGSGHITNIQPLCLSCNSSKGAKIIDYRTQTIHGNVFIKMVNGECLSGHMVDMMKVGIPKLYITTKDRSREVDPNDIRIMDLMDGA